MLLVTALAILVSTTFMDLILLNNTAIRFFLLLRKKLFNAPDLVELLIVKVIAMAINRRIIGIARAG